MPKLDLFYLSSCSTCKRIMQELKVEQYPFRLHDIKNEKITSEQLDHMAQLASGYLPLFSKAALKYRALGLHQLQLSETDLRKYILEEYTFLKRPVFLIGRKIFIGNAQANIKAVQSELNKLHMAKG